MKIEHVKQAVVNLVQIYAQFMMQNKKTTTQTFSKFCVSVFFSVG